MGLLYHADRRLDAARGPRADRDGRARDRDGTGENDRRRRLARADRRT
jgi:hypothetical protein